MALTRAQLLAGNDTQGNVLAGQVRAVTAGTAVSISNTGVLSVNVSGLTPLLDPLYVKLNGGTYNGYVWPNADGGAGQFLQTDGGGNLAWADASGFAVVTVQSGTPTNPDIGELWFDCDTGTLNVYQGCVGTPSPNWFNVSQPGLPVLPGNTSAAPPFTGGSGTLASPYDCTVTTTGAGTSVFVVNTVTISGLAPYQYVPIVDLNAVTNGGRFSFSNNYADASGDLVFQTIFKDQPPSGSGSTYTAAIKVGYGSVYIDAVVNVVSALVVSGGTIAGPTYVGQQLTYTPGAASGGSTPYGSPVISWYADGTLIGGATSATYTLTASELGKTITASTTITDNSGQTATGTSNPFGPILANPGTLTITSAGSIAPATAVQGTTLNYTTGSYTGGIPTVTASWKWQRSGVDIAGVAANAASYVVQAADIGFPITVRYSVTDSATPTAATASASTTAVTPTAPIPTTTWNPGNGMNTGVPGTSSATWQGATGTVTSTGCVVISLDGSSWTQSLTATNGQPLYVQWNMAAPGTCGDAPSGTAISGTVVSGSLINSYAVTVERRPAAFGFAAGSSSATLGSVQTSNAVTISGGGMNAPAYVTLGSLTAGATNFEAEINGSGTFVAIPSPTSTSLVINPGETIKVRYTTSGTPSASFDGIVKIGDSNGTLAIASNPGFIVTNTSSAALPIGVYNPTAGLPNATPAATSLPNTFLPPNALAGTVSTAWNGTEASTVLTPEAGKLLINKNGGTPGAAAVTLTNSGTDTVNVAFDPTYIGTLANNATATANFTSTYLGVSYTNVFSYVVDKDPTWTAPQSTATSAPLNSAVNTGDLTPTAYNSPVTVSFANPSGASGATAMTAVSVTVNGGPATTITLGTTTITLNPGDFFRVTGTTGGTSSTKYGVQITIGASTAQDWFVTTTAVTPTIDTPTAGPTGTNLNPAVNTPAGITLTGSAYVGNNSPGAHNSSDWQLFGNLGTSQTTANAPLESTNQISGTAPASAPSWTEQTSGFSTDTIESVSYGNGTFVAVSGGGRVETSPDGVTWTAQSSPIAGQINGSTFGNGLFVIAGQAGALATSPNGIAWTSRTSNFGLGTITGLTYGNNLYVATGDNVIVTSPDGVTWTSRSSGQGAGSNLYSAAYGNGTYIVAGVSSTNTPILSYSTNGTTWTSVATGFGSSTIAAAAYGNGLFVIGGFSGQIMTSPNGTTWTSRTSGFGATNILGLTYGDGLFVAVGIGGKISTSPDGINWTLQTSGITFNQSGVGYGNGVYVTVGQPGKIATNSLPVGGTALTIAGADTDGFAVGNLISNGLTGASAASGTITAINGTSVTVAPPSANWANGQNLYRGQTIVNVTGDTGNLVSYPVAQALLATSSTYQVRVRYNSINNPPIYSSAWSSYATFTTASAFIPTIGAQIGGGYFAGQINDGGTVYNLIVAPIEGNTSGPATGGALKGQYGGTSPTGIQYKTSNSADLVADQNQVYGGTTSDRYKASGSHPLFNTTWLNNSNGPNGGTMNLATGGAGGGNGIGGYTDWYVPAKNELEVLYYYLKPNSTGSQPNNTSSGSNPNAVAPEPISTNYTGTNPAQTTATAFQGSNAQAFSSATNYWSSSESSSNTGNAWSQAFNSGSQSNGVKSNFLYARAVRRVPA